MDHVRAALIGAAFAAMATPVRAETLQLPSDYLTDADRTPFRICRAAVLIEASAPEESRTVLPPDFVITLREQITFIMSETIFNVPAISLEDGTKRIDFTEQFIVDFSKTIGAEMQRLNDPAKRGQTLIACQSMLWIIMKPNLDLLMKWRMRAMDLDRPFPVYEPPTPEPTAQ